MRAILRTKRYGMEKSPSCMHAYYAPPHAGAHMRAVMPERSGTACRKACAVSMHAN